MTARVIHIHAAAPAKPPEGAACNGCGICCASEPCPLGMLVSHRRSGTCTALVWVDTSGLYRCGLLHAPRRHLPRGLRWSAPLVRRLATRWISAGTGCDAALSADPA